MSENQVRVRPVVLQNFLTELFQKAGMPEGDAAFQSEAMVATNLWGVDSHGVLRAPTYVKRLRQGAINPKPSVKTIRGAGALEVIDGDDGSGFVVGRVAMRRAIELAREYNVGVVGAVRSNHFGATALYARLAAEDGMVGIAMTNVTPNMVAPGGRQPITGNNPLAIAVPSFGPFPFVLDMSLSAVAGGKLLLASAKGERIPLDWATDNEGRPTDDPAKAFAGFLLPMGGHKGLGLSYAVDILCGLITGGVFGDQTKGMYTSPNEPSLTSHMMLAINIGAIISQSEMRTRMDTFYARIKSAPMWNESAEMLVPGEIEYRTARARRDKGIPIPLQTYEELVAMGNEMNVTASLPKFDS